jgi:hypothetical protein
MKEKIKIFLSYAHEDEDMKTQLDRHLIMLKKTEKIEVWQDRKIMAGDTWDESIKKELHDADIILLLISVDFNNSKYIWEHEVSCAMMRHEKDEARVIPVILRKCEWSEMPFAKLQAIPIGAKPVSSFIDKDEAYTTIARSIREVVDYMLSKE